MSTKFSPIFLLALAVFAGLSLNGSSLHAELVTFDLGLSGTSSANGLDLEGFTDATTSVSGSDFVVTMTARSQTTGVFNLVTRGLGINSPGNGDRRGQIDDRNVAAEGLTFSFTVSQPSTITFVSLDLQGIGGSGNSGQDRADLVFSGGPSFAIDGTNVNGANLFNVNQSYDAGTNISLAFGDGNGFRIQAITLDILPNPEPSSIWMFGAFYGVFLTRRRR